MSLHLAEMSAIRLLWHFWQAVSITSSVQGPFQPDARTTSSKKSGSGMSVYGKAQKSRHFLNRLRR
jgi:hypothetical protein